MGATMTPRERVRTAFAHSTPDFTPCDYYATPEIHEALLVHFGLTDVGRASRQGFLPMGGPGDNVLPERLGTDIRYIAPPYIGPPLQTFEDGSTRDLWGVRRRPMPNEFGEYAEPVNAPYAGWETVEQAAAFPWPSPDWLKKELFDLVHSFGVKVTHHCCGSSRALIPQFLACGMDALQTIQRQAVGMDPYDLKREFGGRLVLHGAVDVQGWLQHASVQEIEQEVNHLMDEVGHGGGFVLAPCHQLQPDTPTENVLAVYRTVARRRGRSL